jgi:hypothetical protein
LIAGLLAAALLLLRLDLGYNLLLHVLNPLHHRLYHLLHFVQRVLHHCRHLRQEGLACWRFIEGSQTVNFPLCKSFLINTDIHRL